MANPVPLKIQPRIARILPIANALLPRELAQRALRLVQQRANQLNPGVARRGAAPFHAGQSFPSAPAQQPQKEQFHLIVGLMRQRNRGDAQAHGGASQKIVPRLPRGHLERPPLRAAQSADRHALDHHRQLQPGRLPANQALVGVAAPAAKLVVQMRHRQPPPLPPRQFLQHPQKHERVHPAGNRHEDALPRAQQPVLANHSRYMIPQFAHAQMLFQRPH